MPELLIKNGRIVTASDEFVADILCEDGAISSIGHHLQTGPDVEPQSMTVAHQDGLAAALQRLQEQLHHAGAPAPLRFAADTQLVGGFQTTAQVREFTFTVDEPPQLGGTDTGPNQVELVLAALGTCQVVYATYARLLGTPIESLAIRPGGDLDLRGYVLNGQPLEDAAGIGGQSCG